jgi:hypothetical protein
MNTALVYLCTSLTLAILLPCLFAGSGHEQVGDTETYRYPKRLCRFFLWLLPIYVAMGVFIFSTLSPDDRANGAKDVMFIAFWAVVLGLLVLAYVYFARYRVQIDAQAVTIRTIFKTKPIPLANIAQIATIIDRATELLLFDRNDRVLAKFGGSLQDFESFLSGLQLHMRPGQVTLFRFEQGEWKQRVNGGDWHWMPSEGPKLYRDMNHQLKYIFAIGGLLIALAFIVVTWLDHGGFNHLQR